MKVRGKLYGLIAPSDALIACTVSDEKEKTQQLAFDYLLSTNPSRGWPRRFWKQWDCFIFERRKRGWRVATLFMDTYDEIEEP